MHFQLVDAVVEQSPSRIVTHKHVSNAEEYLQDHFPGYPVLPGVMMLEAMVQAARRLAGKTPTPLVLGQVRALKYGAFVRPGSTLRVTVDLHKQLDGGAIEFKGEAHLLTGFSSDAEPKVAVSGRFVLRPVRQRA
ncbi:MAG: polyketide synthase dehydratase domain-containing protein [Phycisphaerae bacterium]|nr:polyketide synthase dehydratase domain-containing protein [Phycisphaerae bacterium]MBN8597018.1 polyketide synthase dehydratase domain-containing protein [Planctomycetota bacterium]